MLKDHDNYLRKKSFWWVALTPEINIDKHNFIPII